MIVSGPLYHYCCFLNSNSMVSHPCNFIYELNTDCACLFGPRLCVINSNIITVSGPSHHYLSIKLSLFILTYLFGKYNMNSQNHWLWIKHQVCLLYDFLENRVTQHVYVNDRVPQQLVSRESHLKKFYDVVDDLFP